jgi:hypothetical protein
LNGGLAERLRRRRVVDISENAVDRILQLIHRLKLQMSGTSAARRPQSSDKQRRRSSAAIALQIAAPIQVPNIAGAIFLCGSFFVRI